MTRHFGVLIPSTNTTVEIECRLLPAKYQAHVGRLMTSAPGQTFSPPRDDDLDYQSRLLGAAKVELVILAQTSASVFAEDYDEVTTRRMSAGAGVPAVTSAQAIGRAVRALGGAADRAGVALFGRGQPARGRSVRAQPRARNRRPRRLWRDQFLCDRQSRPGARARRLSAHRPARDRGLSSSPAAISRRWPRSPNGSASSASRS